jgi:hypothetical protein
MMNDNSMVLFQSEPSETSWKDWDAWEGGSK